MTKGEETREVILEKAIELFNTQGVSGTSLFDIMNATGLQKGGIYNHFRSKEALAIDAFDYAFQRVSLIMMDSLKSKREPMQRLLGIISFFEGYFESPPIRGGCILLNMAVESDDANPVMRDHARLAMGQWQDLIRKTVERGIAQGVMQSTVKPDMVATLIIGTLEGALMMTKLFNDPIHLQYAINHLIAFVESDIRQ